MEIFVNSSKNIIDLISDFQNQKIDGGTFNKKILVNTIFNHFYFNKDSKKNNKIKENQNKNYQSFFKLEYKTEQSEKLLFANLRDRKGKKMLEENIRNNRENLIQNLAYKKDMKIFLEQTNNIYIPPKNIALSMDFQSNTNNNYNKKYIPNSNLQIQYLNPTQNAKEHKLIQKDFIESPFFPDNDFNIHLKKIKSKENDEEKKDKIDNFESELEKDINNEQKNENEVLIDLIREDDEILFYDEKLKPEENPKEINNWNSKIKNNDMISDFQYLKQKNKIITEQVNELYYTLQQDKIIKNEMSYYLKNSEIMYEKIAQQNHFHEFAAFLNEKLYKYYLKKMNYNYLLLMLCLYFDFEKLANSYKGIIDASKTLVLFVKKLILFVGISNSKVYEPFYIKQKRKIFFRRFFKLFFAYI